MWPQFFDRNGNFLQAKHKAVQMRWKSETAQSKLGSGITLRSSFDVKPGRSWCASSLTMPSNK